MAGGQPCPHCGELIGRRQDFARHATSLNIGCLMEDKQLNSESTWKRGAVTLRGAAFIAIGSMVGAGILALFGEAGKIAGTAVWVSFLIGGSIALLKGYSFAKLGSRYPSAGALIGWIVRGHSSGPFTGGIVMLGYFSVIIVTAMVVVSFGNYATSLFLGEGAPQLWVKIFAAGIVNLLTYVNTIGAEAVTRAQAAIAIIVLARVVEAIWRRISRRLVSVDETGSEPWPAIPSILACTYAKERE